MYTGLNLLDKIEKNQIQHLNGEIFGSQINSSGRKLVDKEKYRLMKKGEKSDKTS